MLTSLSLFFLQLQIFANLLVFFLHHFKIGDSYFRQMYRFSLWTDDCCFSADENTDLYET